MTRTVLYVVDSLGLSGKTRALANLALNLDRDRFRGVVVTLAPPEGMLADQLRAGGVPIEHVPCPDGLQPAAIARLARLARQLRPAIVHGYNPRPMLYGALAAASIGCPAIGSLSAFACMGDDRTYTFLPQPLHTRSRRNRIRNKVIGTTMKRLAVVSERAGAAFCRTNGVPRRKVRVIRYGVDVESVARVPEAEVERVRAEVGAAPGEVVVGSVGRLVEQKDYPTQLRAFAVAARHRRVRMVIAGGGPLAGELRSLAERLGIADRVRFLGERGDIPAVLRAVDAFVLASKFEPYGVSVLEAMAAGLPIISTDVNELPEILDGGLAGVLVPPERPEPLADAIVRVASDPALRQRLAARARSLARERYSLQAAQSAYVGLYEEVLAGGAR